VIDTFATLLVALIERCEAIERVPDTQAQERLIIEFFRSLVNMDTRPDQVDHWPFPAALARSAKVAAPLKGRINRAPWHNRERHDHYRRFLSHLVALRGGDSVLQYMNVYFESALLVQFQRYLAEGLFPPALRRAPRRRTVAVVREQRKEWQSIASDWDRLTRLVYGLLRLEGGERLSWEQTAQPSLGTRVKQHLLVNPCLAPLVQPDWVTIRNALDHGTYIYNPARDRVEFADVHSTIAVATREVRDLEHLA
jgi:hypothetical protein